ncbi:MAG: LLM class flavin-dependent oxidoreductase [Dehalococcoidia bacterium]|nr:LLM class flavin-dependent oxidoreductase [Dehalococcoidia bacterium]
MRFGHFFYPTSLDPAQDGQVIADCLAEAELAEDLGLDAIWMAEHHFVGEVAYGDPLVFAGAVAARTRRIMLGLGIVEMALHNPVHLAIQTALLDVLSNGRLIVGTGRGSNYNAFEYVGFGTTVGEGLERLDEAEELLVKAWTTENLDFKGKYWQVSFPLLRPRPHQQPHPPLARACISEDSITAMARIGRPVLLRYRSVPVMRRTLGLYRDTMLASGFDEAVVEENLDRIWFWCECHVAESDERAMEEFLGPFHEASRYMADVRERWNPADQPVPMAPPPLPRSAYGSSPDPDAPEVLMGSPRRVAEHIAMLRDAGARNLMLTNRGLVSKEQSEASMRLLSTEIMPLFR